LLHNQVIREVKQKQIPRRQSWWWKWWFWHYNGFNVKTFFWL